MAEVTYNLISSGTILFGGAGHFQGGMRWDLKSYGPSIKSTILWERLPDATIEPRWPSHNNRAPPNSLIRRLAIRFQTHPAKWAPAAVYHVPTAVAPPEPGECAMP